MVNLWPGIPESCLCDKHLNAAINEGLNLLIRYHMARGHKIDGWIKNGCIEVGAITNRISNLIIESEHRGEKWAYALTRSDYELCGKYHYDYIKQSKPLSNPEAIAGNPKKLAERCPECKDRMKKAMLTDGEKL